MTFNAINAQN